MTLAESHIATGSMPEPAQKMPAHQHVYEKLRSMILFGDLEPGQAVTIQGLTSELSVGMTPVREALRRLVAEGALTLQGNRRVSVPTLSLDCADELGFIRLALEPELARRAAKRMTDKHLSSLRVIDGELDQAITKGDISGYLTHNYRFHSLIHDCADAPIMAATVDRLWLRFGPSLRVVCGRFGTSSLPDKHADILSAFANHDAERAGQAMTDDVDQGVSQVRLALADS